MSAVLVTGASGFVGGHLLATLAADPGGPPVIALGRRRPARLGAATFVEADLTDAGALAAARPRLRAVSTVIHLAAAVPTVADDSDDADALHAANVVATANLLAVVPDGAHVVFAGTVDQYGVPASLPITEDHPLAPVTRYGRSKVAAEARLRAGCLARGLPLTVLRLTQLYGPGDPVVKAIPSFIAALRAGRAPVLHGDGGELRDYLYVGDAARAFAQAAAGPAGDYRAFNIASGQPVTIAGVLDLLLQVTGAGVRPERAPRRKPAIDLVLDVGRARTELGFAAEVALADGLRRQWAAAGGAP